MDGTPLRSDSAGRLNLSTAYVLSALVCLLLVVLVNAAGVVASAGDVTPFYAAFEPACHSAAVPLVVLLLSCAAIAALPRAVPGLARATRPLSCCALTATAIVAIFTAWWPRTHAVWWSLRGVWDMLRWHLLAFFVFAAFFAALFGAIGRTDWFGREPSRPLVRWFLVALVIFGAVFPASVAMIRDGTHGIVQAYERSCCEYIYDIGITPTIRDLFHDYARIHPRLSMHARVHPPGPVVVLWILSWAVGRDPLPLSLATIAVGSLGVLPLYFWAAAQIGRRAALVCGVLYSLMPSIVMFTATSADILFTPFTLATLLLFQRALSRGSPGLAAGAGAGFAAMSLLSFSLLSLGAYFAIAAAYCLRDPAGRRRVAVVAAFMLLAFAAVHLALWAWSGFDMGAAFRASLAQFRHDQADIDVHAPRYGAWFWRFANPAAWFVFAGLPVSVLFARSLWAAVRGRAPASGGARALVVTCALTFAVLSLAYLGRGEGERSAMYVLPFLALPAALMLDHLCAAARSPVPMAVTAACLGLQCWVMESLLYTYW